jgi:hypothetical protein
MLCNKRDSWNLGGEFEKIRITTVRPVFKNLAPPGIYLISPLPKKKKKYIIIYNTYYFVHNQDSLILKYNL